MSRQWVQDQVLGEAVKIGDFLGSDQIEVRKLIPQDVEGVSHCENPPMLGPSGKCGCHAPGARINQLPRTLAVGPGPKPEKVVLLHHLTYRVTTLR